MKKLNCLTKKISRKSAKTLRLKKAPGPDGIPGEVLRILAKSCPQFLLNMYNICLSIVPIQIDSETIQAQGATQYLGIKIDSKLSFLEQIKTVANKAATITTNLFKMMQNIDGPRPSKRRMLLSVAQSTMLYGAEIFVGALKKEYIKKPMLDVQAERTMRITCFYKTVSFEAALVVAGVIPINLLAGELLLY